MGGGRGDGLVFIRTGRENELGLTETGIALAFVVSGSEFGDEVRRVVTTVISQDRGHLNDRKTSR